MPMINEAIYTLYEGVATAEDIDTVMNTDDLVAIEAAAL